MKEDKIVNVVFRSRGAGKTTEMIAVLEKKMLVLIDEKAELRAENECLRLLLEEVAKVPYTHAEFLERTVESVKNKDIYGAMIGTAKGIGDLIAFKLHPHPMTQKETDTK